MVPAQTRGSRPHREGRSADATVTNYRATVMKPPTNPPAFEAAVREYLEPVRSQFNYEQMLHTFLSTERFQRWAQVIDAYHRLDGARVLSSGCGFGGSLLAYRAAGAAVAVGVEVDETYLDFGSLRTADLPRAGVVAYDGTRLPFPDSSFDVVESIDVVEHTRDPEAYVAELARVLAPGGVILLVTPNRLFPVEQHLGIAGPPWMPVPVADAVFSGLARMPGLDEDRRFRYRKLRGMRLQNVGMWSLRRIAKRQGLFLRRLRPADHAGHWPLPAESPRWEQLAQHRAGVWVTPVRTLVALLHPAD